MGHKDTIYQDVLEFMRNPAAGEFEPLALRVFAFQYGRNLPYRRYCERRGAAPGGIADWRDIPAVPTAAFKELDLRCGPPVKVFMTSGTTRGVEKRGRHSLPRLDLYRASALPNFRAHLLPDGARLKMLILAASPEIRPDSSLSHMLEMVREEYGERSSGYFFGKDSGVEVEALARELKSAAARGEPVFLLGITLAFHQFIEQCCENNQRFLLPPGSRLMDTGGFKGRRIELSKTDLYRRYEETFGIPQTHLVNEYGMTEMGSQFYDNVLADKYNGMDRPRHKRSPAWTRTLVLDPETLEELPAGKTGLLRHFDLANCGTVLALQTDDLGHYTDHGFDISGRASAAEARGCSLTVEDIKKVK